MNVHLTVLGLLVVGTTSLIVPTQRARDDQKICPDEHIRTVSTYDVRVCYMNNVASRSILIWFTTSQIVYDEFHSYRFILRTIDELSLATTHIQTLTNLTGLVDTNNSLRLFNLHAGQYEICVEFQSNVTLFLYQPRDGCISLRIGQSSHVTLRQSSIQVFIALATGIVLFFILGLVVQWSKTRRQRRKDSPPEKRAKPPHPEQRSRASSILSTTSLRKQRARIARKLFRHHLDSPGSSSMRQWARNRAFRHRISTHEQDAAPSRSTIEKLVQPLSSTSPTNGIYTIPMKPSSRRISFSSNLPEDFVIV